MVDKENITHRWVKQGHGNYERIALSSKTTSPIPRGLSDRSTGGIDCSLPSSASASSSPAWTIYSDEVVEAQSLGGGPDQGGLKKVGASDKEELKNDGVSTSSQAGTVSRLNETAQTRCSSANSSFLF